MRLFAISDLHLAIGVDKPMEVFGSSWEDYHAKIEREWERRVCDEDTVILGGDLSWALKLEEAAVDFDFIHRLPGTKVLFKGNHDYWWNSLKKVQEALPESMYAVQNSYYPFRGTGGPAALCGTRGWTIPAGEASNSQDQKIYNRETGRLKLSLESAVRDGFRRLIVTLHYPPFPPEGDESGFTQLMQEFGVKICLFGHLHGDDQDRAFTGEKQGIMYYFIAADYLEFAPQQVKLDVFEQQVSE